jgi:hypothetical protein
MTKTGMRLWFLSLDVHYASAPVPITYGVPTAFAGRAAVRLFAGVSFTD